MKVAVDTNVLIRAVFPITDDTEDAVQAQGASALMRRADTILVSLPVFCEFEWVLRSIYRVSPDEIGDAIRALLRVGNLVCDRRAVGFGLDVLARGGDFADGLIAEAGFGAGAEQFASFDRKAVQMIRAFGRNAGAPT